LTETEQAELRDFLSKYKTSEPLTEIDDKDATRPFVRVKVPQSSNRAATPVVFEVRIEHK
jgi:hypothetical protein